MSTTIYLYDKETGTFEGTLKGDIETPLLNIDDHQDFVVDKAPDLYNLPQRWDGLNWEFDQAEYDRLNPAPEPVPFDTLKLKAINRINAEFERSVEKLTSEYTISERISFSAQDAEARSLDLDAQASAPLLSAIANQRGETTQALAQKVIAKSDAYQAVFGDLLGKKQALIAQVNVMSEANNSGADLEILTFN